MLRPADLAAFYATCVLVPWRPDDPTAPVGRVCRWCGDPLPKGRRVWCREEHRDAWVDNHYWGFARAAARRRSPRCEVCGYGDEMMREAMLAVRREDPESGAYVQVVRTGGYWATGHDGLVAFARRCALEVNHRVPLMDLVHGRAQRHGVAGCHHHQENLQILCHEHHARETARQRRERGARLRTERLLAKYPDVLTLGG